MTPNDKATIANLDPHSRQVLRGFIRTFGPCTIRFVPTDERKETESPTEDVRTLLKPQPTTNPKTEKPPDTNRRLF